MSSNEDDYSSEEDEDYVPEDEAENAVSDEEVDHDSEEDPQKNRDSIEKELQKEKKDDIDDLWKNFKNDVQKKPSDPDQLNSDDKSNHEKIVTEEDTTTKIQSDKAAVNEATSGKDETITITKVYDFAGEEVKVTKEVKRDSEEARSHFKTQSSSAPKGLLGKGIGGGIKRPSGGIGSVLGKLGKKAKISTLEKSRLDWQKYKQDEGIEDELQSYNKGKGGYLEKVSFLERTEMRQFEKERDLRLKQFGKR